MPPDAGVLGLGHSRLLIHVHGIHFVAVTTLRAVIGQQAGHLRAFITGACARYFSGVLILPVSADQTSRLAWILGHLF